MRFLLTLSVFIIPPTGYRVPDVPLLTLLASAAQQNHNAFAIFAEVNSVSRAKINPVLEYAEAYAFDIGEVTLAHSGDRNRYFGRGLRVQVVKPLSVTADAIASQIFEDLI